MASIDRITEYAMHSTHVENCRPTPYCELPIWPMSPPSKSRIGVFFLSKQVWYQLIDLELVENLAGLGGFEPLIDSIEGESQQRFF